MSMARIIVFAKAPHAGEVKTRLCPPLRPQGAALLHARMVRRTLATACAAAPGQVEIGMRVITDSIPVTRSPACERTMRIA